jgi:hypothetical protein
MIEPGLHPRVGLRASREDEQKNYGKQTDVCHFLPRCGFLIGIVKT